MMYTRKKTSEHLEEHEVNKLTKYLIANNLLSYYLSVRIGISTALRFGDLSKIRWSDILNKDMLLIKEEKTQKTREIPLSKDLTTAVNKVYIKLGEPNKQSPIIHVQIRTMNKQLKIYAVKAGIRGKRISTHTWRKTFGREVWKRNNKSEEALVKLSHLFNHSSVAITRIYLSITKEEVDQLYELQDLFIY